MGASGSGNSYSNLKSPLREPKPAPAAHDDGNGRNGPFFLARDDRGESLADVFDTLSVEIDVHVNRVEVAQPIRLSDLSYWNIPRIFAPVPKGINREEGIRFQLRFKLRKQPRFRYNGIRR